MCYQNGFVHDTIGKVNHDYNLSSFVLDIDPSCVCFKNATIYLGMENAYN